MVQPINLENLANAIAEAIDVDFFVERIVYGVPEAASMYRNAAKASSGGSAPSFEEQSAALIRMRAAAQEYVRAHIEVEARRMLIDPVRLLVKKLEADAMEHILRQEIGDMATLDELLRAIRTLTREEAESLPRKWIPKTPGRPRSRGENDLFSQRAKLLDEIERRKPSHASRDELMDSIARDWNMSRAALDRLQYPRRVRTRSHRGTNSR